MFKARPMGPAPASTPRPRAPAVKKGHFTLQATNSITKAIPKIMIPELKLFPATIPAMGMVRSIMNPIFFHLLMLLPSSVISAASITISAILTNSVG